MLLLFDTFLIRVWDTVVATVKAMVDIFLRRGIRWDDRGLVGKTQMLPVSAILCTCVSLYVVRSVWQLFNHLCFHPSAFVVNFCSDRLVDLNCCLVSSSTIVILNLLLFRFM